MNDIPATIMVAITDIAGQLDREKSIEEQFRKAMELALNHWLVVNEDDRFKSAVGAVIVDASEEEREIVANEMKGLRTLSAMISDVPVDASRFVEQVEGKKFYGLAKMWFDVKKGEKG
jgi:uncharacterized protein YunC (DUF1805 family)